MSIGQSCAMEAVERGGVSKNMGLKIQNPSDISSVKKNGGYQEETYSPDSVDQIYCDNSENSRKTLPPPMQAVISTAAPNTMSSSMLSATHTETVCNFSITIPTIVKGTDIENSDADNNRIDGSKESDLFSGTFIPGMGKIPTNTCDLEMAGVGGPTIGQSSYQLVCDSGDDDGARYDGTKSGVAKEIDETSPKAELKAQNKSTYKDIIPTVKSFVSFFVSLVASTGLAFFACNLGAEANDVIAYTLFAVALVSNAILYHKTIMGLTTDDFKVNSNESVLKILETAVPIAVKFSIALVSSIPLAFVTYLVNFVQWIPLAYASCSTSLACTIPLFYKAQTAFVDYVEYISNLVNEKNSQKKIRGWDFHNAKEELSALNRDEINALHNEFLKLKAAHPHDDISDDGFKEFISLMLPEKLDTPNRFWLKEGVGLASSVFSAVFGGMYLFLVSDPIYEAFLKTASHARGSGFISHGYKNTALSGAILVTIGQNALQANTVYGISKIYWMKLMRSYEKRMFGQHAELSVKRDISHYQQYQEYAIDFSKAILASGSATARAALALTYIDNPVLLACVLTGTDISYFATFYWGMSYIENWTETGTKRSELTAFLNAQKAKYISYS